MRRIAHLSLTFLAIVMASDGCSSQPLPSSNVTTQRLLMVDAHEGRTAETIAAVQLREAVLAADIILIGEQHGHMAGHHLQRQLISEWAANGLLSAVSLEMLTRDEQAHADRYLAGETSRADFITAIEGASDTARGRWLHRYQSLVDVARAHGIPVVAANAPRDLVKQAREQGEGFAASLSPQQQRLVTVPAFAPSAEYRQRFARAMQAHPMPDGQTISDAMVDAMFRSQLIWDATMAHSIANALTAHGPRIVHTVGAFHITHDGGLVQALRQSAPHARILTIAITPAPDPADAVPSNEASTSAATSPIADVVIQTPETPTGSQP